jgi:RNA polymerase sigma-70 factor (ECF subfamily)
MTSSGVDGVDAHGADPRSADASRTVEAVWRIESARLIAGLIRMVRDVGLAEEFAQQRARAGPPRGPRGGIRCPSAPGPPAEP